MSKIHLAAIPGRPETWCGRIDPHAVKRYEAETVDKACKTCRKRSCEDCGGTGFIGGKTVGVCCGCEFDVELDFFTFED